MNEHEPSAPPETSDLELADRPVPSGTLIDAFTKTRPRDRMLRGLKITLALLFLGITALAGVLVLRRGEPGHGEATKLLQQVQAAMERSVTPEKPRQTTEMIAPTGATIPNTVFIDSLPDGAEVRIEGERLGVTPLMLGRSYDGDFAQVELRHPGYHLWRGKVQIVEHGIRADVTLKPR